MSEPICERATVTVPGKFHAKARPRFARVGNGVRTFTPHDTVEYENWIRQCWIEQTGGRRFEDDQALKLFIMVWFPVPKSTSNKKRDLMLHGVIHPTKKPDGDNVLKTIADALIGVAMRDDSQITQATVVKRYGLVEEVTFIITTDD